MLIHLIKNGKDNLVTKRINDGVYHIVLHGH